MNNKALLKAKEQKNDEFYTQLDDIQKEVWNYRAHFKDKKVLCNCDNPEYSCFWQYFFSEFKQLEMKKLSAIYFSRESSGCLAEYYGEGEVVTTELCGNGDFRSEESQKILQESDIIVTNPPFSLFREYILQLIGYEKNFLIIGPIAAISYKDVFPLFRGNKVWAGYGFNQEFVFQIPNTSDITQKAGYMKDGKKYVKMSAVGWFTNLNTGKQKEELALYKEYEEDKYPKYDNFDAINVKRVAEIPKDYDGLMGVPISFIGKYCPTQFEILALLTDSYGEGLVQGTPVYVDEKHKRSICGVLNGKRQFPKIIIKRREN